VSDVDIRDLRREPPRFRRVAVAAVTDLSPRMRRMTFAGTDLEGMEIDQPAASVRLLLPSSGSSELVMPEWTGNEFLFQDGRRPLIRTFTPRNLRTDPPELDIDIVLHGLEGASGWAMRAEPGDPAAVSGPGRGYEFDPGAEPLLLLGDETAIPAIGQLAEKAPASIRVVAHIEVARPDARIVLPGDLTWHDLGAGNPPGTELLDSLAGIHLGERARVWAAGEATAMQHLRKHLTERGMDRSRTTVRGYWKAGRAGPG